MAKKRKPGLSANTLRSVTRDLRYWWKWVLCVYGWPRIEYPVKRSWVLAFIKQHAEGLSDDLIAALIRLKVKRYRKQDRFTTLNQRVVSLSSEHTRRGLPSLMADIEVMQALASAKRIMTASGRGKDQPEPITKRILDWVLQVIPSDTLHGVRDRAIITYGFYSGGRRCSEIINARAENLRYAQRGYHLTLYFSKTDQLGKGLVVPIYRKAYQAVKNWLTVSGIEAGPLFRPIVGVKILDRPMSKDALANMLRKYIALSGLDPALYSMHSLRSGYITEAARQGVGVRDIQQLTGHRSVRSIEPYMRFGELENNRGALLS